MDTDGRLVEILSRLNKVKVCGDRYMARCPAHPDEDPSLSLSIGREGRIIMRCFAGCKAQQIMSAIRLPFTMLFPYPEDRQSGLSKEAFRTNVETRWEDEKRIKRAQKLYQEALALAGTPGANYLESRGIPTKLAVRNGVRYADQFPYGTDHAAAVVFPMYSATIPRRIVAVNGRFLYPAQDTDGDKARTYGKPSLGIFGTKGAIKLEVIIIVEAPIDALSLTVTGYPALATCGVQNLRYFPDLFHDKTVVTAFDLDTNPATQTTIRANIERFKAEHPGRVIWVKPPGGELKDWNDMLRRYGPDGLRVYMQKAGAKCRPPIFKQTELNITKEVAHIDKACDCSMPENERIALLEERILTALRSRPAPIMINQGTAITDIALYARADARSAFSKSSMIRDAARSRLQVLGIDIEN